MCFTKLSKLTITIQVNQHVHLHMESGSEMNSD